MCTVILTPGVTPTAVNKYIHINNSVTKHALQLIPLVAHAFHYIRLRILNYSRPGRLYSHVRGVII